jgi:hypothetical protein
MKLPAMAENENEDREGQIIERIYLIEKAAATMDSLFDLFFCSSPNRRIGKRAGAGLEMAFPDIRPLSNL